MKGLLDDLQQQNLNKKGSIKLILDQSEAADKEINQWEEEALKRARSRKFTLFSPGSSIRDNPTEKGHPEFHNISPFLTDEDIKILIKQSAQLEQIFEQLETKLVCEDEMTDKLKEKVTTLSNDNVKE